MYDDGDGGVGFWVYLGEERLYERIGYRICLRWFLDDKVKVENMLGFDNY